MAEFNVWLLILGIAGGALATWAVMGTVARRDDDQAAAERALEADWISRTIEDHGGHIPVALVDQVLDLHRRYLLGRVGGPFEPEPDEGAEEAPVSEGSPVGSPAHAHGSQAGEAAPRPDEA